MPNDDPNSVVDPERPVAGDSDLHLFAAVKSLFGDYIEAHNLDTEQLERVKYREFFDWVCSGMRLSIKAQALLDQGVSPGVIETLRKIFSCEFKAARVFELWWPMLTRARPAPKHLVKTVVMQVVLFFQDDVSGTVSARLDCPPSGMTDAALASQLNFQLRQLSLQLLRLGVDGVYEAVVQQAPAGVSNEEGSGLPPLRDV